MPQTETAGSEQAYEANTASGGFDLDRLERAVATLAAEHRQLQEEARSLRAALDDRESRIRALEEQLLAANQRRQDTGKRLDELIAQLDRLDAQLASVEPAR